jgi:hypothetical protein
MVACMHVAVCSGGIDVVGPRHVLVSQFVAEEMVCYRTTACMCSQGSYNGSRAIAVTDGLLTFESHGFDEFVWWFGLHMRRPHVHKLLSICASLGMDTCGSYSGMMTAGCLAV